MAVRAGLSPAPCESMFQEDRHHFCNHALLGQCLVFRLLLEYETIAACGVGRVWTPGTTAALCTHPPTSEDTPGWRHLLRVGGMLTPLLMLGLAFYRTDAPSMIECRCASMVDRRNPRQGHGAHGYWSRSMVPMQGRGQRGGRAFEVSTCSYSQFSWAGLQTRSREADSRSFASLHTAPGNFRSPLLHLWRLTSFDKALSIRACGSADVTSIPCVQPR